MRNTERIKKETLPHILIDCFSLSTSSAVLPFEYASICFGFCASAMALVREMVRVLIVFAMEISPIFIASSIRLVIRRSSPVFRMLPRLVTTFQIPRLKNVLISAIENAFLSVWNSGISLLFARY